MARGEYQPCRLVVSEASSLRLYNISAKTVDSVNGATNLVLNSVGQPLPANTPCDWQFSFQDITRVVLHTDDDCALFLYAQTYEFLFSFASSNARQVFFDMLSQAGRASAGFVAHGLFPPLFCKALPLPPEADLSCGQRGGGASAPGHPVRVPARHGRRAHRAGHGPLRQGLRGRGQGARVNVRLGREGSGAGPGGLTILGNGAARRTDLGQQHRGERDTVPA